MKEPFRWVGDSNSAAAWRIMQELNQEGEYRSARDALTLVGTSILEMNRPYQYMLSRLKDYTTSGRKQLYLHGSQTRHSLEEVPQEDVADLKLGEYPAIEALAFAVTAVLRISRFSVMPPPPRLCRTTDADSRGIIVSDGGKMPVRSCGVASAGSARG